jgi:hypothetical protein
MYSLRQVGVADKAQNSENGESRSTQSNMPISKGTMMRTRQVLCATLCIACGTTTALGADYVPAHCQAVGDTLNIFWEAVGGIHAPCTGIEYTNGRFADTVGGTFSMTGTSVSDSSCIATAAYTFTLSGDKQSLVGNDTFNHVPMTLTISADGACYVGHWVSGTDDYVATFWAVAAQGDEIFNDGFQ